MLCILNFTNKLTISFLIAGVLSSSAKLMGILPSLSYFMVELNIILITPKAFSAPFISKCLIDLVDYKSSEDFTAR
jgi:hypothetical protein